MKKAVKTIEKLISEPECFLTQSEERRGTLAKMLQDLYAGLIKDVNGASEVTAVKNAMPELMVAGFDAEQIWEQLQLLNTPLLKHLRSKVDQISNNENNPEAHNNNSTEEAEHHAVTYEGPEEEATALGNEGSSSKAAAKKKKKTKKKKKGERETKQKNKRTIEGDERESGSLDFAEGEEKEAREEGGEEEEEENEGKVRELTGSRSMASEDESMFDLDEDELDEIADFDYRDGDYQVLERQRAEAEDAEADGNEDDDDDDDADIDFNAPIDEGDARDLRYDGFFDAPLPRPRSGKKEEGGGDEEEGEEGAAEGGEAEDEEEDGEGDSELLSKYEQQKRQMREQIENLEKKIVQPREWILSGEVDSARRPSDSLLETDLDFLMAQRLPEPITEETTLELEDLIKQRIINEVWDDVERKDPPKETPFKPKKELSTEKSNVGLAELYEREYVAKATGQEDDHELKAELSEAHTEIARLMAELNYKLDALSNFHFTPKPHIEELKVVTKAPAIAMEEVLPMAVSKEETVAPQEEFKSQSMGMPTQRAEMSKGERNTQRNTKKKRVRKRRRAKEQQDKIKAKTNSKKATEMIVKKAQESKILSSGEVDNTDYSKSSAFFAKLQASEGDDKDEGSAQFKRRPKKRGGTSSSKLKL